LPTRSGSPFAAISSHFTAATDAASALYDASLQPKKLQIFTTAYHGTDLLTRNQGEIARTTILTWLDQYLPVNEPAAEG
jgi:hypothetical protein